MIGEKVQRGGQLIHAATTYMHLLDTEWLRIAGWQPPGAQTRTRNRPRETVWGASSKMIVVPHFADLIENHRLRTR